MGAAALTAPGPGDIFPDPRERRFWPRRMPIATNEVRSDRRRLPRWLPPLLWAAVILGASSLQDLQTRAMGIEIRDKLAHFGEYFVFGWLLARSFDGLGWRPAKIFAWTLAFGVLMGAVDEFYQGFVPGRERDGLDLLADSFGVLAGWYFSREDEVGAPDRDPGNA